MLSRTNRLTWTLSGSDAGFLDSVKTTVHQRRNGVKHLTEKNLCQKKPKPTRSWGKTQATGQVNGWGNNAAIYPHHREKLAMRHNGKRTTWRRGCLKLWIKDLETHTHIIFVLGDNSIHELIYRWGCIRQLQESTCNPWVQFTNVLFF